MKYRYSTKEGIFEAEYYYQIPIDNLHSFNDKSAFENLITGWEEWYFEGNLHRETGPAIIRSNENYSFCLNGFYYENVNDWLENHPNKDITFQAFMRLKYT